MFQNPSRRALFLLFAYISAAGASPVPQTIDFPAPAGRYTESPPFKPEATASSGLPVSISIVAGQDVAEWIDGELTLTGNPGVVTLRASQGGDAEHLPAPDAFASFPVSSGSPWVELAGGVEHALGRRADGSIWLWTAPSGPGLDPLPPAQVGTANDWIRIAAGGNFSAGIRADGSFWRWSHFSGPPEQVGTDTDWESLALSQNATFGIKRDGSLWAWGSNTSGMLGIPGPDLPMPTRVGSSADWKEISASFNHVVAIRADGTLWSWGSNADAQLGHGNRGGSSAVPTRVGTGTDWVHATAGPNLSFGVRADGSLWAWGRGGSTLGAGEFPPLSVNAPQMIDDGDWRRVSASGGIVLAIRQDGSLWGWGANNNGNLGSRNPAGNIWRPTLVDDSRDWVAVDAGAIAGLREGGMLWTWGIHQLVAEMPNVPRPVPVEPRPLRAFSAGGAHSAAVAADGSLWAWGGNSSGQLGIGGSEPREAPVRVGEENDWETVRAGDAHTLALKADGSLWAWGRNQFGQLGDGTTASVRRTPVRIGDNTEWRKIAAGGNSFGIRADGSLWAWGRNVGGSLGIGSTLLQRSPVRVGPAAWLTVSSGGAHTLGIQADGTLWGWGRGNFGQVGDGTTETRLEPVKIGSHDDWIAISAGERHSLGLRADGSLWAWGYNFGALLGVDTGTMHQTTPVRVGTDGDWVAVSASGSNAGAGEFHSIAVKSDGTLWAWGMNTSGQLGDPDAVEFGPPARVGTGNAWAAVPVESGASARHSLALTRDGTLWSFGLGADGQLGTGAGFQDTGVPAPLAREVRPQVPDVPPVVVPTFGVAVPLTGATSCGLPVQYAVTGPAEIQGNSLIVTGPGNVELIAWQPGDAAWLPAGPVSVPLAWVPDISLTSAGDPLEPGAMLDLGKSLPGESIVREITVSNPGTAALLLGFVSVTGEDSPPFDVTRLRDVSVPPGESIVIEVSFSTDRPGLQSETLVIASNAPGPAGLLRIRLQGYALSPPIVMNDDPVVTLPEDSAIVNFNLATVFSDPDEPFDSLTLDVLPGHGADLLAGAAIAGGMLALSPVPDANGSTSVRLRATDSEGLAAEALLNVMVTPVNDPPRAVALPDAVTAPDAAPLQLDVASGFTDVDLSREGDALRFTLAVNSAPDLFSAVELDEASGALVLRIAPYRSGEAVLEFLASDLVGESAISPLRVIVPALAPPQIAVEGEPRLNRQTGLLEWRVTATNTGPRDLGGFVLTLSGLPESVVLNNRSGSGPVLEHLQPLPTGASVTLVLEFHAADRSASFSPEIAVEPALPVAHPVPAVPGLAIDRVERLPDGLLIEFPAVPDRRYEIQYSEDARTWKVSPMTIRAAGTRVQWIDRGPPATDSPPAEQASRFYRVRELPEP